GGRAACDEHPGWRIRGAARCDRSGSAAATRNLAGGFQDGRPEAGRTGRKEKVLRAATEALRAGAGENFSTTSDRVLAALFITARIGIRLAIVAARELR